MTNVEPLFAPDEDVAAEHLCRVFGACEDEYPDGLIEIRHGAPDGGSMVCRHFGILELGDAARYATEANAGQRNVYFGLNPRKPGTARERAANASDVEIAFYQVADIDSAASLKKRLPLPPTFTVVTGKEPNNRGHYYWELAEPVRNIEAWSKQQQALQRHFASDKIHDAARILRLPGTVSYPTKAKRSRGYGLENVRVKYHEDRLPVSSQAMWSWYPYEDPIKLNLAISDGAPDEYHLDCIRSGENWNNNAFIMVARLVLKGLPDEAILSIARGWTLPGYTVQQTLSEVGGMLRRTRERQAAGEFGQAAPEAVHETLGEINLEPLGILKPRERKKRQFIVPNRLMRGHTTLTSAPPGVGKTLHALQEAVSLASGQDFMNIGIEGRYNVAIINNEESRDELERRIEATCIHFQIAFEEIADRLFLHSGVDAGKFVVAREVQGAVVYTPHQERVSQLINQLKIDVLVLDPFVQTHFVSENANEAISRVMVGMREMLTGDHQCALNLVHHIRKPQAGNTHVAGDMFSARGAGSMQGEAHMVYTLADMTPKEAEKLGVSDDDRGWYLRLDDAKAKLSPPTAAQWFEREGVEIPRQIGTEEVGVLVPWTPPDDPLHVTSATAHAILTVIDSRWKNGTPFSKQGDRSLLRFIVKEHGLTRLSAKNLLRQWDENGVTGYEIQDKKLKTRGYLVRKWPGKAAK